MNLSVDQLLEEREIKGLRVAQYARFVFITFLFLGLANSQSPFETLALSIICPFMYAATGFFLYRLKRGRSLRAVGMGGLVMDCLLIATMPVIFYLSVGGTATTPAFTLKNLVPLFAIIMIAANSLAIRPLYPLVIGIVAACVNLSLLAYAMQDPRVIYTEDLKEEFMGEAIMPPLHVIKSIMVFSVGGFLSLLTFRARGAIHEAVHLEQSNARIGRYFSPGVAARIASADEAFLRPGGVQQNVAVLFSDIRNFTAMSERLSPAEVVEMLSEYHEKMVAVIFAQGGTLDKFIGDAIMATFGTPDTAPDDALRAVRAGIAMKRALVELNRTREAAGKPALQSGIGIHYGPVVAGNIGTATRLEYTVIGDTVNTASRLESACKKAGHDFLISRAVLEEIQDDPDIRTRALGSLRAKGKSEPFEIFAVEN